MGIIKPKLKNQKIVTHRRSSTLIGEVYLDGNLVFQSLEVMDDGQLEHALNKEFRVTKEISDTISNL